MNTYIIEHKIKTLLNIDMNNKSIDHNPSFNIDNFIFFQYLTVDYDWEGNWYVKKEILSENMQDAINIFRKDLDKIVSKISILGQAYIDFYKESFLIYKKNNNKNNIFYFRFTIEDSPVELHFSDNELESFHSIPDFENSYSAFRLLKECINTTGYIPKLLTLFPVLESLSGYVEKPDKQGVVRITYNVEKMKQIITDKLYNKFYGPGGIRHKIMHGEFVNVDEDYMGLIYKKILEFFNKTYNIKMDLNIVSPQRNFYENYLESRTFLKCKETKFINVRNCQKEFIKEKNGYKLEHYENDVDEKDTINY